MQECCELGSNLFMGAEESYTSFDAWHNKSGYRSQVGSIHAFVRALKAHPAFRKARIIHKRKWVDGKLTSVFEGIGLRSNSSETSDVRF